MMNKNSLAVAMLVVGVILLVWGINMSGAFESQVSRVFTRAPTDKAMWAMVGGAVLTAVGVFNLFFRKK